MKPFDERGLFRPGADGANLRRLAVRGAGATVFSGALALGVQIVATVVLGRILLPADFGVMAMVTTFSMLLINFGLNGFTEAVLQREELDQRMVSNLFWINIGSGVVLTLVFAACGTLLGRFYGDQRVPGVAVAMSSTILITTLSVQHLALLKRAMMFSVVSVNDIFARLVSVVVSIVMGATGWGYWALVGGAIAQSSSVTIGAWILCRWMPGLPSRVPGTGSMVTFALSTYGRFIANYCTWNLDNLLVGHNFGPIALGFYKKAYDLFALSTSQLTAPLTSVAVSALSKLKKDRVEYTRHLLAALGVVAFVGMGLGADLTLIGKDVIRMLLGPHWGEAGRIFMYFGPGVGIMLLYYTHGWIHLSIGRADRWLGWGLIEFGVTATLFLGALHWGPAGIAVAWSVSFWILTLPSFWYAGKPIDLKMGPLVAALWKYPVASLLAGGASAIIIRALPGVFGGPDELIRIILRIVMVSALFFALYLGAIIVLHRGCGPIYQVARLLRDMAPARFSKKASPDANQTAIDPAAAKPEPTSATNLVA